MVDERKDKIGGWYDYEGNATKGTDKDKGRRIR